MKPLPVLTLNAGSSSLKFALFGTHADDVLLSGEIENIGHLAHADVHTLFHARAADGRILADAEVSGHDHAAALGYLLNWLSNTFEAGRIGAVSHRIVHGGADFAAPVVLNDAVLATLTDLIPLAPLHQPHGLNGVRAMRALLPDVPQIACFDTAFHRSNPEIYQRFALPESMWAQGIRRYGFHGLSYDYIASILPEHLPEQSRARVIVAHLGNGASLCALHNGKSIASTMGFTALDGLIMGTRCGRLDAGVLLHLLDQGMPPHEISNLLYKQSGLLGISGESSDMRTLLGSQSDAARQAVEMFCISVAREIAGLAVPLGGVDALVFTGGIGSHAAPVRARVGELLAWMGIQLDSALNQSGRPGTISANTSQVHTLTLSTNEERVLALAGFQHLQTC
ncbi:acetate/propionate family kinase [Burkholderiaceae bacterium DAT-1]|nr:acetate/propionate family kinase [Burkholderiaceae bacterium DAT-1]